MHAGIASDRLVGFAVALVVAALVTAGLFELMQRLVRPPRAAVRRPRTVTVVLLDRPYAPVAPMPPRTNRERHRLPPRPPVGVRPGAATQRGPAARTVPAQPSATRSRSVASPLLLGLGDGFWHRGHASRLFTPAELPPRPPSVFELPQRLRLSAGIEIDRIGRRCYVVTSDLAYNGEANGNPVLAGVMHTMLPLFAHEVPCESGGDDAFLRELLDRLRRRGYGGRH